MFAKGTSIVLLLASLALAMPSQQLDAKKCDAAIVALVAGINKNIDVQKQELAQTKILQKQAAGTIVKATYDADVKTLQNIIAEGAKIRENNQKIAPPGNKALDGLKVVEGAQAEEAKLATTLTGAAADKATLDTLEKDFTGGAAKNTQNAQDALTDGCTL